MTPTPSVHLRQELCLFAYQVLRLLPSSSSTTTTSPSTTFEKDGGNENSQPQLSSALFSFLDNQVQSNHPSLAPLAIHILLRTSSADSIYVFYCLQSCRFMPPSSEYMHCYFSSQFARSPTPPPFTWSSIDQ